MLRDSPAGIPDGRPAGYQAVYEFLGVEPILNAAGPATRLGGLPMDPRVAGAMVTASQSCVRMEELQHAAGAYLATATGTQAALVTCGAGAALTLAVAACLTGYDVGATNRLPRVAGREPRVLMLRAQRYPYDHLVGVAGAKISEVGYPQLTHLYEIREALTADVAAFLFYPNQTSESPALTEIVTACHDRGVPVIVDAALQDCPPVVDRTWVEAGADLVLFSGGKTIGGPQASGALCGRRDLVEAAMLQNLDMDVHEETWVLRRMLDDGTVARPPHHGIGRAMKVGKEEIAGMVTAVRLFQQRDYAAYLAGLEQRAGDLVAALTARADVRATVVATGYAPLVRLDFGDDHEHGDVWKVLRRLQEGSPRVHLNESLAWRGVAIADLRGIDPADDAVLRQALHEALAQTRR